MNKYYSSDIFSSLPANIVFYVEFFDGYKEIGYITQDEDDIKSNSYKILPINMRNYIHCFKRSYVKKLVNVENGFVYPKNLNTLQTHKKVLDLVELNDLVNKAGYELG